MMIRITRFFLLCLASQLIAGCSSENGFIRFPGVYKMDIHQGNIITETQVNQLKPGMTREQVAYVMGQPVLENLFNNNRWDYVYSSQKGGKPRQQKNVSLFFKNNRLISLSGDLLPVSSNEKSSVDTDKNGKSNSE